ncbi:MAG: efflux RND transporter periplasmic adaptor subunit [Paracoccaceae bacterium]
MRLLHAAFAVALLAGPSLADAPLAVEIVTARLAPDTRELSLTGEVVARDPLSISFPVGGRIASVLVEAGDVVAAGAPLARMESVQQEQALRAAQAGLATAQADHAQAVEDLERQNALLERGATTRISRDSAEDALRISEGVLAQAQADLDRAEKALEDTVLAAPSAATVTERTAEAGQVVGAAQPVMTLALGQGLDAVFDMPEAYLTLDLPSPGVRLTPIDAPGVVIEGKVREISPLVDPATGTVAVTVEIPEGAPGLTYGDAVRGTITRAETPHVMLPHTAMTARADGPAVWVVDPDSMTVSLRPIRVARFETGRIVVQDGLPEGTLVVTRGAHLLYPGRVVREAEGSE